MCAYRRTKRQATGGLVELSRSLAWILRHGASECGLQLSPGGYLFVDDILKVARFRRYSAGDVEEVVQTDDKKRFHVQRDVQGRLMIRATQGHTLKVSDDELLTQITRAADAPVVVHGTSQAAWGHIKHEGLKTMRRKHIHFAIGLPGDPGVRSGMSTSCVIAIYLDVKKALRDGIQLFRSENNVILSEGIGGVIHPRYFKKVINRTTGLPEEDVDIVSKLASFKFS